MKTKELSFLEKLPMYFVAWSLPLVFAIMAAVALGFYPYGDVCIAVLKAKFMVILMVGGSVFNLCMHALRKLKKQGKTSPTHLLTTVLLPLAYFSLYFGMNKILVAGICFAGSLAGILSAQETMRTPNHTSEGIRQPADGSPKPSM